MPQSATGELSSFVVIVNERGLHARAAARFVKIAERFTADITVEKGEARVSARSIMGLMMLAAACGTEVKICATGFDAGEALDALTDLVKRKFDEE
jgi:phosphocarrier protein